MGGTNRNAKESGSLRTRAITIFALVLIAFFAVFVRVPHCTDMAVGELPGNRTDKYGVPYFIELDGYYHVRMADEIAKTGSYGTPSEVTGEPWDGIRFYPEGRSAVYESGMVWMDVLIWRFLSLFGDIDLHIVDFWFSALSAVVTVLVVYIFGYRMAQSIRTNPVISGLLASFLVSCAPAFISRTLCGTFDTDLVQTPVAVLLFLLMTEMLRSESLKRSIAFALMSGALAAAFTKLWSVSLAFIIVAILGGAMYVIASFFKRSLEEEHNRVTQIRRDSTVGLVTMIFITVLGIIWLQGPDYITSSLRTGAGLTTDAVMANMPNMLTSVAELRAVDADAVLHGIGGINVLLMAAAGLLFLAFSLITRRGDTHLPCAYLCILITWLVMCAFGLRMGLRSIEHLCAPMGILAGIGTAKIAGSIYDKVSGSDNPGIKALCIALSIAFCAAILIQPSIKAYKVYTSPRGIVSDASENAMDWISSNAESPDAVIASWWDMGYYYTFETEHPTLWDGGSMDSVRAIVLGKALTTDDMEFSSSLIKMLVHSGNSAPEMLMDKLGAKDGFDALWETADMKSDDAKNTLIEKYSLNAVDAKEVERLIHPSEDHETYLIVTNRMTGMLGWIEFFGNWDFEGENTRPVYVGYNKTPDGKIEKDKAKGSDKAFFEKRDRETIMRLYFDNEKGPFTLVYESSDGIDKVQVWKLD